MYKTHSRPSRSSSPKRKSFSGGSKFRSRPKNGGSPRFSNGKRGGNRRGNFSKPSKLDISTFINKAVETKQEEEKFVPDNSFAELSINTNLKNNILEKNYKEMTPIQDKTIPLILQGKDIVGLANTGTGKTAAFLIPLINKILLDRDEQIIILAPTRELAIQIEEELRSFTENMRIFSTTCVGGTPIYKQIRKLQKPNQFIIGTPGRIMDLMKRNVLKLDNIKTIVLDEADRMLDMGFINDIRFIISKMPKERHTLFFSATMSPVIENLITEFLENPINISVKTQNTSKNINQDVIKLEGRDKLKVLGELLSNPEFSKVLIFGRTKHGVERLSKKLFKQGFKTESIHGNKNHEQRQRSLKKFKEDGVQTLIATDIVARGLDINNVSHVINYDLPETYDDYIHRIGRTGRASKTGTALTFVD